METKVVELRVNTNLDQTNNDVTKLKSNLKGAESGAKDFDKAIGTKKGGSFKELGGAIGDIIPSFGAASQGAGVLNKALLTLVANPIGLVIAGVTLVVVALVNIFKGFTPVMDKVEQGMEAISSVLTVVNNAFLAVFTGTKSLTEAFGGLGGSMSKAAKEAIALTKAQQDLDDAMEQQDVAIAKLDNRIAKLNIQAKNRNLTEKQKIDLLKESENLEKASLKIKIKNGDEAVRIARAQIAKAAKLNNEEIRLLKVKGIAYKDDIEKRTKGADELFANLKKAILNRESLEGSSIQKLEKNQNKQDAFFEKQQAKREAIAAAKKIADDKDDANKLKRKEKEIAEEKSQNALLAELDDLVTKDQLENEKLIADAKKANDDALKTENQLKIDAENLAFQTKKEKLIQANLSTEEIEKQHKTNLANLELEYRAKESDAAVKATADAQAEADKKKAIEQSTFDLKISLWNQTASALGGLSNVFKKGTAAAKGAALAEVAIGTATGLINGLDIAQKSAKGTGPAAAFAFPLFYATQVAAVFGAVGKAKAILGSSGAGGGGGSSAPNTGGSSAPIAPPNFNVVGTSGQNQIAQTLNREQPPVKAYVVANDVTTQQGLTRNIVKSASVG